MNTPHAIAGAINTQSNVQTDVSTNLHHLQYQYLPIRLSHLLMHSGVGAVVRGPDYLMIIQDISDWTMPDDGGPREILFVEQIKATLNITQNLCEPPIAHIDQNEQVEGVCIPARRFPSWMSCVSCGLMHKKPWYQQNTDEPVCQGMRNGKPCRKPLVQVSLVLVHNEGHISDLDWHYLAHKDASQPKQKQCGREPLSLELINHKIIRCRKCNAQAQVRAGAKMTFFGKGQPWQQLPLEKPPKDLAEVMEINDTRIHRSVTVNALIIPPESRIDRNSVVARLYCSPELRAKLNFRGSPLQTGSRKRKLALSMGCSVKDIDDAIAQIEDGFPHIDPQMTTLKLLEAEYKALLEPIPDLKEDEDFVTNHLTDEWHAILSQRSKNSLSQKLNHLISHVIEIRKLKEIMVFKGFTRGGITDEEEPTLVPPAIDKDIGWLPALELYGEGIFINFDESIIAQWEKHPEVIKRTEVFKNRYAKANIKFDPDIIITPRFMFLHALSHLLIRQLEIQAGYPSAALKERIYASGGIDAPMAGILIYVAISDVDGTLGGLAELSKPERLEKVLSKAFEKARWCSLDPVCASHDGQGVGLLNKAACHACELLPETSCFCGNILLDRLFVKGDKVSGLPSVLDYVSI